MIGIVGGPAGFGGVPGTPWDVPVDPDAPEARDWLREELGLDAYSGQSTFLDDVVRWFQRLFDQLNGGGGGEGGGAFGLVVVIAVVAGLIVVAFLVYGVPRLRRRSRVTGDLFGEDDDRSSRTLRSAADAAAENGDYTTAVVEAFRALARGLAERGIVDTFPGTTARDFAVRSGTPFPAAAGRLREAATVFDEVRYLGGIGTVEQWQRMSALERELRSARPAGPRRAEDAFTGSRA